MCVGSPFHILTDPSDYNGTTTYGPGWAVTNNTLLTDTARQLGSKALGCNTCGEDGTIQKGLRMEVRGTVVTVDPPVLEVSSIKYLPEGEMGCGDVGGDEMMTTTTDGGSTEIDESDSTSSSATIYVFVSSFVTMVGMCLLV